MRLKLGSFILRAPWQPCILAFLLSCSKLILLILSYVGRKGWKEGKAVQARFEYWNVYYLPSFSGMLKCSLQRRHAQSKLVPCNGKAGRTERIFKATQSTAQQTSKL